MRRALRPTPRPPRHSSFRPLLQFHLPGLPSFLELDGRPSRIQPNPTTPLCRRSWAAHCLSQGVGGPAVLLRLRGHLLAYGLTAHTGPSGPGKANRDQEGGTSGSLWPALVPPPALCPSSLPSSAHPRLHPGTGSATWLPPCPALGAGPRPPGPVASQGQAHTTQEGRARLGGRSGCQSRSLPALILPPFCPISPPHSTHSGRVRESRVEELAHAPPTLFPRPTPQQLPPRSTAGQGLSAIARAVPHAASPGALLRLLSDRGLGLLARGHSQSSGSQDCHLTPTKSTKGQLGKGQNLLPSAKVTGYSQPALVGVGGGFAAARLLYWHASCTLPPAGLKPPPPQAPGLVTCLGQGWPRRPHHQQGLLCLSSLPLLSLVTWGSHGLLSGYLKRGLLGCPQPPSPRGPLSAPLVASLRLSCLSSSSALSSLGQASHCPEDASVPGPISRPPPLSHAAPAGILLGFHHWGFSADPPP